MSVIVADRSTSYGLAALAVAVATLAAVSPLISGFGWPSGHDGIWVFPRIAVMAERFALGDVIPVWSSLDNYGLGSPEPIFYNKLFYYPAALIYLAVGSLKLAGLVTLAGFLAVGGFGMAALGRRLGAPPVIAAIAAAAFMLASYTTGNWLARAAIAEFSAAMLVPWVVRWMVILVTERRWPVHIGPLLFLLYLAHAGIAYAAVYVLAIAYAWRFVASPGTALSRAEIGRAVLSVAIFALATAPFLLTSLRLAEVFNLDAWRTTFDITQYHLPLVDYVFDVHLWLDDTERYMSPQLDLPAVAIALFGLVWLAVRRPAGEAERRAATALVMLALCSVVLMVMQTPLANPVYRTVPGLDFLQFPTRLLSLLTPCVFGMALATLALMWRRRLANAATLLAVTMVFGSVAVTSAYFNRDIDWFSSQRVEEPPLTRLMFDQVFEYLPLTEPFEPDAMVHTIRTRVYDTTAGGACVIADPAPPPVEVRERRFEIDCPAAASVPLPVFFAPGMGVADETGAALAYDRTIDDPRLRIDLAAGRHTVTVSLPTLATVLASWLED